PKPELFEDGWPSEITLETLAPFHKTVGEMMSAQPVPTNQWPARSQLVYYAAKATGNGDRFRSLDRRVTFDPDRPYALPDSHIVIIAGGSLSSTELRLLARDEHHTLHNVSTRLGVGWSSNGDFFTPAIHPDRDVSPTRGPTITSAIDFLDGSEGGQRFFIEDG